MTPSPEIAKLYQLLAAGQLIVPHDPEGRAALETWVRAVLPPETPLAAWAVHEAKRLEPHLSARWDRYPHAPCCQIEGRFGYLWGDAHTWQAAWIQALFSCWRTMAWRARRDQVIAGAVERGLRRAA
jgi:hypothetical protein